MTIAIHPVNGIPSRLEPVADFLREGGLDQMPAPILVCAGRYDPWALTTRKQELSDGISNTNLLIFEHSSHIPFLEELNKSKGKTIKFQKEF